MEQAALRLAAVACLLNGGLAPWPTIAGEFVYDSIRDDIIDMVPTQRKPLIVVRTDEDEVQFKNHLANVRRVRLLVEVSVLTAVEDKVTGKSKIDWPKTDPALEMMLNMMEWQVWNALVGYGTWALWFRRGTPNVGTVLGYTSIPRFAPPNRGAVRLAVRTLEFVMQIPVPCLVQPINETSPVVAPFLPPSLVDVIEYILAHGGGDFKTAVIGLGQMLNTYGAVQPERVPALRRVWTSYPDYELETNWPVQQVTALEWAPYTVGQATVGVPSIT